MTEQEIYDKVKTHLLAQGRRSVMTGREEGRDVHCQIVKRALILLGISEEYMPTVAALQKIHDLISPENRESRLKEQALYQGFTP